MKQGTSFGELVRGVKAVADKRHDLIADTRSMQVGARADGTLVLGIETGDGLEGPFDANGRFVQQVATWAGIPMAYAERMRAHAPKLLVDNLQTWLSNPDTLRKAGKGSKSARRMVRTIDGTARAFLSDSYHRFDNWELLQRVIPVFEEIDQKHGGFRVESCNVDDDRLYIKLVLTGWTDSVGTLPNGKPDLIAPGIVISNSEVGLGSLTTSYMVYRLVCTNGLVSQHAVRRYHVGRTQGVADDMVVLAQDTLAAMDSAFWLQVRDGLNSMVDPNRFARAVADFRAAKERPIVIEPDKSVEVLAKQSDLSEGEQSLVLRALLDGGDLTHFGMVNAVTLAAQHVDSYSRATAMEELGGRVLEMDARGLRSLLGDPDKARVLVPVPAMPS